jgi:hypothetical protein
MEKIVNVLVVTFGILMSFVLYRLLLKRLNKGSVNQALYCTLYSLDKDPVEGEVEFYFITPVAMNVTFCIWQKDQKLMELRNEEFGKGGHIVRFDTNQIEDGEYFFGIETADQKTIKRFNIKNS